MPAPEDILVFLRFGLGGPSSESSDDSDSVLLLKGSTRAVVGGVRAFVGEARPRAGAGFGGAGFDGEARPGGRGAALGGAVRLKSSLTSPPGPDSESGVSSRLRLPPRLLPVVVS